MDNRPGQREEYLAVSDDSLVLASPDWSTAEVVVSEVSTVASPAHVHGLSGISRFKSISSREMIISCSPGVRGEDVAVDFVDAVARGLLWWSWSCHLSGFTISKYRIAFLNYKEIDIKWSQGQFPYWFFGLTTEHLVASLQDRERRI